MKGDNKALVHSGEEGKEIPLEQAVKLTKVTAKLNQ